MDARFFTSKGSETFCCRKLFLQDAFQSIQRAVSERVRDNSTLGSPVHRFVKNVFIHIPGFQPVPPENLEISERMGVIFPS